MLLPQSVISRWLQVAVFGAAAAMFARPILTILAACLCLQLAATKDAAANQQLQTFLATVEQLVLDTTDRALLVTRSVYLNISKEMSPPLLDATGPLLQDYVQQVDAALHTQQTYAAKRKLFQQFKRNSVLIEQLRAQLAPLQPPFQFQLISDEFYNARRNCTEFDRLYSAFMSAFAAASQRLWDSLSERTVEEEQELLELLDEIANEQQLREKDKLYDEFIETYLFKRDENQFESKELFRK